MPTELIKPDKMNLATFNLLRDRRDRAAIGDIEQIIADHPKLHAIATQEARDYEDVLGRLDGWRYFTKLHPRGANQNGWLVREDVKATYPRAVPLGGDGWTTTGGDHHVGSVAMGITLAGWLYAVSVHLPPSIDWKGGHPVGPDERVDDYIANIKTLKRQANARRDWKAKVTNVKQRSRYGSDHHLVTFTIERVGDHRGRLFVGDWNNRPARDKGLYSPEWLADQTGMRVYQAENAAGPGMFGIDYPVA